MTPAAPPVGAPAAEVELGAARVARLIAAQVPEYAGLEITPLDAGWDNAMFRVGAALCARFPRRAVAVTLLENEQTWQPTLAARLPVATPTLLRVGAPGEGYPWSWSLLSWLPGAPVGVGALAPGEARRWGAFLTALHMPAPADAPRNPFRGVALRARDDAVRPRLERLAALGHGVTPIIAALWDDALAAPIDVAPTWIHGDLHALNVLADAGEISGVVDWGDMAAGDRATDLASIWALFDDADERRKAQRACAALSPATWARARGWAVFFGAVLLDEGLVNSPRHAVIGARILERLAADTRADG